MAKTILERLLGYESYDEGRDPLDTGYGNIEPKPMGAAEFGKGLLDMGGQAARGTVAGAIALPHDISTIGTALYQLQDDLPDRDKMNWWEAFGTRMANAEAAQPDWLPSYQDADQALPEFTPMSETFADYSEGNRPIETFSSMAFAPYPYVKAYQGLKGIPNPLREGGALNPKRVEGVVESPRIRLLEQMDEQAQLPAPQPRLPFIAEPEAPKPPAQLQAPLGRNQVLYEDGDPVMGVGLFKHFKPKALQSVDYGHRGREVVVNMPIKQFLKLSDTFDNNVPDAYKITDLANVDKYNDIPQLSFGEPKNGVAQVTNHEGRHRAVKLLERGETTMPVRIKAMSDEYNAIRWDAQTKPDDYYYSDVFPEKMIGQSQSEAYKSGEMFDFPVKRGESGILPNVNESSLTPQPEPGRQILDELLSMGRDPFPAAPEEEIQNFIVTGKKPYSWNLSDTQVDIPMEKMGDYAFNQMADPRQHWKYKDATLYDPRSESELVPLITKSGDQILSNRQADVNDLQWNWAHRAPPSIMNMSKEQFKPPIPDNPNEVPAYGEHLDFRGRDPESGKWLVDPKPIKSSLYDYALDGDFFKMARRDEMLIRPRTLRQTENLWANGFRPKRGTDAFNEYKTWPELNAALRDRKIDHNDLPYFEFRDRFARTKEDFPLVAQHNIRDFEGLEGLVKEGKGQLVAPSLSVSPAENPNDQFGKISLLFDPKIIDEPTTASYSHDAYTGRVDLPKKRYQRTDVYDGLRDKMPLLKDVDNAQLEKYYNDYLVQNEMIPKYHGHQNRNFNDFVRSLSLLEQSARADGQTLAEHIKMYEEIGVRPWFGMKNSRGYIDEPGLGGYADPQLMFTGEAAPTISPQGPIPAYSGTAKSGTETGIDTFVGPFGMYSPERALQAFKARKGTQKGSEGIVNQRAMMAKKFSGLEDMQQNRHLIETDESLFPWARNASRNQWPKIQKDIRDVVQANRGGDYDFQNEVGEIFATKLLNDEKVSDFFGKYPWSKGDIENITSQIKDWQRYFGEMVPGDYFESKVGRNVSLNEVRLAMIPTEYFDEKTIAKTIKTLQDAGVQKVLTYGSRKEREAILKRHPELLLTVVGMTLMAPILLQQEQGDGS